MTLVKKALAQAAVMLVLFAVAVAGIDLLLYIWLEVLPDEAVVLVVLSVALYQARRVCRE